MFLKLAIFSVIFSIMTITPNSFAQAPPIEPGVSQTLAKWRAANYSDVRYELNLTIEKMSPTLKGTIEIRVNLSEPPASAGGDAMQIILDWRKINGLEEYSSVSNVSINGRDLSRTSEPPADAGGSDNFTESNEHLIFKNGVKFGENVIKLDFTSPIAKSGVAVTRYVDKEDGGEYIYSLFVPSDASTAFPVFDQPDLKARFQLNIDAPSEWKIVSNTMTNGLKVFGTTHEPNWKSHTVTSFKETKPISTYVFAFAAGDFAEMSVPSAVADGLTSQSESRSNASNVKLQPPATAGGTDLPMKIYFRKSQVSKLKNANSRSADVSSASEKSGNDTGGRDVRGPIKHTPIDEVFRLNREAVKYLEDYFDYKFPFPKYDLVLIPEFPFGGMEHAGATFLREDRIIFPSEPTKNDYISRANLIFHEAAHQWFGDTVTMRWFDDLWLKEGFAEFMAYKTLEKVLPEYNAWKVFYERNKQAAYLTDVTRGTTPIYQEIANLSSAKSAYGNIVYRKAPSFLKQAEFYLGEDKFQTAVRAFLKKYEFKNAEWTDLVREFETAGNQNLTDWANVWVKQRGLPVFRMKIENPTKFGELTGIPAKIKLRFSQSDVLYSDTIWPQKLQFFYVYENGKTRSEMISLGKNDKEIEELWGINFLGREARASRENLKPPKFIFTNYQDHGYGIFLLDEKSRAYVLENIQNEKDDFLRSMMWGSLWDSVRFYEFAPEEYVKLVIRNLSTELRLQPRKTSAPSGIELKETGSNAEITSKDVTLNDESTIATLLGRVSTAVTYYLSEPPASAGGSGADQRTSRSVVKPPTDAGGSDLSAQFEKLLIEKVQSSPTAGLKITYYRAFVANAASETARKLLKEFLRSAGIPAGNERVSANVTPPQEAVAGRLPALPALPALRSKDKFDIVTRLIVLGDEDGLKLLAEVEKTETDDAAKRYAYAARAGIPTAENKAKYWKDFTENKEIPESWIEAAFSVWNSPKHADLTLPYLEKALAELPNLKQNRKIFFVNGWLSSFIGGQKSEEALNIVNRFLENNPKLDRDLRLKILENADNLERAVKIRKN